MLYNTATILLHLTTLLIGILLVFIIRMKKKQEIHFISIALISSIFIWCAGMLAQAYSVGVFGYNGMAFTNTYFTAVGFVSVLIFLLGLSFSSGSIKQRRNYLLLILPAVNSIFIWTNDFHHLFFVKYSLINTEIIRGPVLEIQTVIAYLLILAGLSFLLYFSIKNTGFFTNQSMLIVIGTVVPLFVDIAFVFNLFTFSMYYEPISFAFAVMCFMIAILKYDFLSIVPIALQTVVDHISDSYLVVNENFKIVDFNRTCAENFAAISNLKRKMNIWTLIAQVKEATADNSNYFHDVLHQAIQERKSAYFEKNINTGGFHKVFAVEVTPIITQDRYRGIIILLKDITEIRESFEFVKQTQAQLLEKEHLISLGQLVGGIAHNLKTPIMSVSGGIEGLDDLISEYEASMDNPGVSKEDHLEIAHEMRGWLDKMRNYCEYMSDVISTVKGQAVQLTSSTTNSFELNELLKRIDILMNHELKKFGCKLNVACGIEKSTMIKGEVNSLVQIINNLITNSIESYEGKEGNIDFLISQEGLMLQMCVRDYGCGMPDAVKDRLFKEMLTTKAKKGTGLGLYMSYSTIVGKFGGRMWFDSEVGKGTSFCISIPVI